MRVRRAGFSALFACVLACGGKALATPGDTAAALDGAADDTRDVGGPLPKDGSTQIVSGDAVAEASLGATDGSTDMTTDEMDGSASLDATDDVPVCEPPNPFGTYPNCVCCLP
ncbi:MAG: hypothetical protein ACLP1X_04635 [Polyangiaceae bacterium]